MALNPTQLGKDIQAVFDSNPSTAKEAAFGLAKAYFTYAKPCLFGASAPFPPLGDDRRDAMASIIEVALNPNLGLPVVFAAAWAAAVTAFWLAVPCNGGSGVGATNGCPGAAGLTGSMAAVVLNLANTKQTAGQGMGLALHAATMTTTATLTLPPAGPLVWPIS